MKSFTISCLICAINLNLALKKLLRKAKGSRGCQKRKKLLKSYQAQFSLQSSSPIWASEVSLARTRKRGAEENPSRPRRSLTRSRETRFTLPNRRACSQAKHNRDAPTSVKNVYNRVREWSLPRGCLHIKLKPFASVEPLPG